VVHDPAKAVASFRKTSVALAAAALIMAAAASGCGGGTNTQPQVDVGPNVGQPISLADCNDWKQADTAQRLGTIQQLKDFAGGPIVGNNASSPSGTGSVLKDQDAYDLFNRWCGQSFARGFKLYKLYQRAAAFTGQPEQ
jgi:hypothetical protein